MEPASSIHLGNRYERVGSPADDVERGQLAWSAPRGPSRRQLLLAFGAGMLLTALGFSVHGSRDQIGEKLPGKLGAWVASGKGSAEAGRLEVVASAGQSGLVVSVQTVQATKTVTATVAPANWTPQPVASGSAPASVSAPARPNLSPFRIHYNNEPGINNRGPIRPPACPVTILYSDRDGADVVVWNSDKHEVISAADLAREREDRPWQKHLIWGVESGPNRGALQEYEDRVREGKQSETLDGSMTYFLEGVAPAVYAYDYFNFNNAPLRWEDKRQDKIAAVFVTNCNPKNGRNIITQELLDLLPGQIDSFGPCKNNANLEETLRELGMYDQVGSPTRWNLKITLLRKYKFVLALENSNDIDYVTEKFFQPMEQGSVPLYFGTPHFKERFLPTPNAAVDIADYVSDDLRQLSHSGRPAPSSLDAESRTGIKRLADRLTFWTSEAGRSEYEAMLDWKKDEKWKESAFGKVVQLGREPLHADCRVAGWFRGEEWGQSSWTPTEEMKRR